MSLRFAFRSICLVIGLVLFVAFYAYVIEPRMVLLKRVDVPIEGLPANLNGFTIGVVADLHLETTPLSTIRSAAKRLAALKPDIVVAVGDFTEDPSLLDDMNEALGTLTNLYGVPGNWDRWSENPDNLDLIDAQMLVNRGVSVAPGLWLCGIDDALLGFPSLDKAVVGAPECAIRILLVHEPDVANWVKPEHKIALQISGHSHGGQICLPYIDPLLLPPLGEQYPSGLAQAPTHWVYTTKGVGTSHIRVRFLCPPEIALLRLVSP